MNLTAFAVNLISPIERDGDCQLLDPHWRSIWGGVSQFVKEKLKFADGMLDKGAIHTEDALGFLAVAVGIQPGLLGGSWEPPEVQHLHRKASWPSHVDNKDQWAYLSAVMFLETCAQHDLGITFVTE